MAVPKKRTSKSKKNKRKSCWKNSALKLVLNAMSLSSRQKFE